MDWFAISVLFVIGFCSMVGTLIGHGLAVLIKKLWRM